MGDAANGPIWHRVTHLAQVSHISRLLAPPGVPVRGLPEAEFRRGFDAVLSEREAGDGVWLFAYGALLWERGFAWDGERIAELPGLAARDCLWDERSRGTLDRRSYTLGLLPGDGCAGAAPHLAETGSEDDLWKVWRHEMPPGYDRVRRVDVRTGAGPVRALTFVADAGHPLYAGDVPEAEVAAVLASTSGESGTASEYLPETARAPRERGVPDPYLERLQGLVTSRARAV